MILTESEIQQAEEQAKAAFPNFTNWKYNNEKNEYYCGFSIWGQFALTEKDSISPYFYVTFDTYENKWRGNLTVGQHCYFWSSTNEGDAQLLNTEPKETLEAAIGALKAEIANLFGAFSVV